MKRLRAMCVAGVLAVSGCAAVAAAQAPSVVVLDRALAARAGALLGVREGAYLVTDAQGQAVALAAGEVLAIVEADWWNPEPGSSDVAAPAVGEGGGLMGGTDRSQRGVLELTDGTRLVGTLAARDPENADLVAWNHPALGRMVFALERVKRVDFGPEELMGGAGGAGGARSTRHADDQSALPEAGDVVELANGDRLVGFVERLGNQIVVRAGSGASAQLSTPDAHVVRSVRLANPPARAAGLMVWLRGGNTLRVSDLQAGGSDSARLVFEPAEGLSRNINVRLDQYRAIVPRAERVVALAGLAVAAQKAAADRLAPGALRVHTRTEDLLGAADIELPGPMTAEWVLPAGARRLAGWLVMPAAAREWGDCVVRVSEVTGAGGAETTRVLREGRLNAEKPWMTLAQGLGGTAGARLRVEVESGERGPIQDRVVLRRMLIAVGE
ncbi:MAG: hypothetical protein ACKVS8_04750 [Phycisphaerales bacterium]